jgi:hypothetical protein
MAKTKTVYPYPSVFGSHKSMAVAEAVDGMVTCKDNLGEYVTEEYRLDNGEADPNRCAEKRLAPLFNRKKDEK